MLAAIANHLWQSTLVAGVAALLALALKNNPARSRYWLWMIASLKFLIPFSLLVLAGSYVSFPAATISSTPQLSVMAAEFSQPFAKVQPVAVAMPASKPQHESHLERIFCGIWIFGSVVIGFRRVRRWREVSAVARAGKPLDVDALVRVVSSASMVEPGVFGIFRPVLLLPAGITEHLNAEHLKAIVAHELCHVRHRDNLAAAIHMLVETIFWFHPMVWWLGGRLVAEREQACDEEVLRLGNAPQVYAESILKTCEFYLESPLACVSGVTGADLKQRVTRIMRQPALRGLNLRRKLMLSVAAVAAVLVPISFGVLHAAPGDDVGSQKGPAFEVASIKPDKQSGRNHNTRIRHEPGGRFEALGVPLQLLLEESYDVKDTQVIGAPAWFASERFDIQAKPDEETAAKIRQLGREQAKEQMKLMLRELLKDRCKLKLEEGTRELPVYAMVVAKGGPKFHESASSGDSDPAKTGVFMNGRGEVSLISAPLAVFADVLSRQLQRPVLDNTGLKGNYDFSLKWTPDQSEMQMGPKAPGDAAPPPEGTGPSIFTAMQEQLGLKLEGEKAPMKVLVIEHIEKPSEN